MTRFDKVYQIKCNRKEEKKNKQTNIKRKLSL